jgi:hypothetical protein
MPEVEVIRERLRRLGEAAECMRVNRDFALREVQKIWPPAVMARRFGEVADISEVTETLLYDLRHPERLPQELRPEIRNTREICTSYGCMDLARFSRFLDRYYTCAGKRAREEYRLRRELLR